ncbi:MAG: 50S ribosomal protein L18 [Balneolales bacterium]
MTKNTKKLRRARIRRRVRSKIVGTETRPRLSVYKSSKHTYTQLIDDSTGTTLVSASTRNSDLQDALKGKTPLEKAEELGKVVAEKALEKKIETITFDRSGYSYHGIVLSVATGARTAGLKF